MANDEVFIPVEILDMSEVGQYCESCPKTYAAMYYERHAKSRDPFDDGAFRAAANTFLREIKLGTYGRRLTRLQWRTGDSQYIDKFSRKSDFIQNWNTLCDITIYKRLYVMQYMRTAAVMARYTDLLSTQIRN